MFKIGDIVCLNPKVIGGVDTEIGYVQETSYRNGREKVTVYWEKSRNNDGGEWHTHWLLLV